MRKIVLVSIAIMLSCIVSAQDVEGKLNAIFPVQNTVTTQYPEFTGVSVDQVTEYLGKKIYQASFIYLYKGQERMLGMGYGNVKQVNNCDTGLFVSFTYFTKRDSEFSGPWNSSSEATQFAFHPGGINDSKSANYSDSDKPYYTPLYGFTYSDSEGLNLVDLSTAQIIANIGGGGDIKKYAYLSVFAGNTRNSEDFIVVAGNQGLNVYGVFVNNGSSQVRQIEYTRTPSYFDLNGQKLDFPRQGINIVVDGETAKKVVVK